MKQNWFCEVCGLSGATEIEKQSDVFSVVYAIENHHDRLAHEYAPYCRFDVHKVRIHNPDLMTIYEWNRLVSQHERHPKVRP